jgi:hypothetical protein
VAVLAVLAVLVVGLVMAAVLVGWALELDQAVSEWGKVRVLVLAAHLRNRRFQSTSS